VYPEKAESWKPLTSSLKEQRRLPLEDLYDMVLQAVWTMNTALFNTTHRIFPVRTIILLVSLG
jgi:hypothetical protein